MATTDQERIFTLVRKDLADFSNLAYSKAKTPTSVENITAETKMADLGLDSTAIVEFGLRLEGLFLIHIDCERFTDRSTVQDYVDYLSRFKTISIP